MDNSDLTVHVLREIRDLIAETNAGLRETNAELRATNARLDQTNAKLDAGIARLDARMDEGFARLDRRIDLLTEATRDGFTEVTNRIDGTDARIDNVLLIVGTHLRPRPPRDPD